MELKGEGNGKNEQRMKTKQFVTRHGLLGATTWRALQSSNQNPKNFVPRQDHHVPQHTNDNYVR